MRAQSSGFGSTAATGPSLILGAGSYTLTGTPPTGGPFELGTQIAIDPSAASTASVTLPFTAVMLTMTAQVGTTPRGDAALTLTPASGTGPPRQSTDGSTTSARLKFAVAGTE